MDDIHMNLHINLPPNVWGPKMWFAIDSIAFGLPEIINNETQIAFKNFMNSLILLLPCEKCRYHYSEYLKKNNLSNINFVNKNDVIKWINKLHNSVSKINNKREFLYQDTISYYNEKFNIETKTTYNDIFILIIFFIIILNVIKYLYFI